MKLYKIQTSIGKAILADLSDNPEPINTPANHGLILWGLCDRVVFANVVANASCTTDWLAVYSPTEKAAIVVYIACYGVKLGDRVTFDTSIILPTCPSCDSDNYISKGENWMCKECDRQWRKHPKPRGGGGRGAGRKAKLAETIEAPRLYPIEGELPKL